MAKCVAGGYFSNGPFHSFDALSGYFTDMVDSDILKCALDSATHIAIIVAESNGKIILINQGAANLFGYTQQEAEGKNLQELTFSVEDQSSHLFEEILESLKGKGWTGGKFLRRDKSGRRFSTISNFTFLKGSNEKCKGILEIAQDMPPDLLNLERELKTSKNFMLNILESSIDAIVTTDIKGNITYVNRAFRKLIGLPGHQIIGKHISIYYKDGINQARKIMNKLREAGRIRDYEFDMKIGDKIIPIRTSDTLLYGDYGEIVGTMGVFQDITDRKKLLEELSTTQAELIQAVKMKALGDLVTGVAHEINNPLMASDTFLHLLENETSDNPGLQKRVLLLKKCNQRIKNIVKKLKAFSMQAGTEFTPMDVNEAILSVLEITQQQTLNQCIEVKYNPRGNLPRVLGDKNQIEQVLLNLISNACDAMKGSSHKVLTVYTDLDQKARQIRIGVKDTGIGITEEQIEQIFNPFFTTKGTDEGMGLGLSICYKIIEAHSGKIEVKSRLNEGSGFIVILPSYIESCKSAEMSHETGENNVS